MVRGILLGSVVAKKKYTRAGGSSRIFSSALNAPFDSMCTSSMMKTRLLPPLVEYCAMSRSSRMLSTPVLLAASISSTSRSPPRAIALQVSHWPQGSPSLGAAQLIALASRRATVVLPQPRGPENR